MKLNVSFARDNDGKDKPIITDDRGEPMPCVKAVTVEYVFKEATIVTIKLVVDRKNVTVGEVLP